MQRKILTTTEHGKVMQVTFTPWEIAVLRTMAGKANINEIAKFLNCDVSSVGVVLKNLFNILEK